MKVNECKRRLFLIDLVVRRLLSYLPAITDGIENIKLKIAIEYVLCEISEISRLVEADYKYIDSCNTESKEEK